MTDRKISEVIVMPELERSDKVETNTQEKIVYWHRELPPLAAEVMGEHTVEATSGRVPGTLAHRDELWNKCLDDLMAQARSRLEQEVLRLGGNYAHVLTESVDSQHDDASTETWLHGRFTYVLYRRLAVQCAPCSGTQTV
jgi:hypothetical protein